MEEKFNLEQLIQLVEVFGGNEEFSNEPGRNDVIEHDIQLASDVPIRLRPYRVAFRQTEIFKSKIKRMLELNIINKGESDCTSPMILDQCSDHDTRSCSDNRKLNAVTRPECFHLPNIEEHVERVATAQYVSLKSPHGQIPMTPRAQSV